MNEIPSVTRRQLLKMLGVTTLGGAAGVLGACSASGGRTAEASTKRGASAGHKKAVGKNTRADNAAAGSSAGQRVLVVVEMQGGHDGFAALVPYGDARFHKLREKIWTDPKELVVLDDRYALSKGLGVIKDRLAFVEGVGVSKPDLSHFAMMSRWWAGDPDGNAPIGAGFLGRCCDALRGDEPITGISVGKGSTPALITAKASTVALPQLDMVREVTKDEPDVKRVRAALQNLAGVPDRKSFGAGDEADRLASVAQRGMQDGLELLATLTSIGEVPKLYPEGNDLASALALVRQLVSINSGMRIFHVPWGSFDTHTNEQGTHADHMNRFGLAMDAFHTDLEQSGLSDRVLVATTSEFGRRPESNAGGTDHGTASTMMLSGPVKVGRHGVAPDFAKLDRDGNVHAAVSMADYYATLAQWLGIAPGEVLGKGANPIAGLLA
jgi:uncharacterized protein (DUF1501 family)